MSEGNVHVESIKITAEDHASHPAEKAAKAFDKTSHSAHDLGEKLKHAGHESAEAGKHMAHADHAAHGLGERLHHVRGHAIAMAASLAGVGFGFEQIAEKSLEANQELGKITKSIATVHFGFEGWKKNVSSVERMKISMEEAHEVVEKLEESEERLATPLADLAGTYRTLAGPAFERLGLNQKETFELFEKTAAAAKAMGVEGQAAAMTVTRALITGRVRAVDPFGAKLRDALGTVKNLSQHDILKRITTGLGQLGPAADILSKGMGASLFRIKLFFEHTLRDVGAPVIQHIAGLFTKWQKILEHARESGHDLVKEFGEKLVRAFEAVEKTSALILSHWKILAGIWASSKALGMMSGGAAGLAGRFASAGGLGAATGLGGQLGAVSKGLSTFATSLSAAGLAAYALGKAFEWWLEKKGTENVERQNKAQVLGSSITAAAEAFKKAQTQQGGEQARIAFAHLRSIPGLLDDRRRLNKEAFKGFYKSGENKEQRGLIDAVLGKEAYKGYSPTFAEGVNHIADAFAKQIELIAQGRPELFAPILKNAEEEDAHKKVKPITQQNFGDIYITQDFKDADPDRVFVAINRVFEGLADNPKQSNQGSPYPY